MEIKKFTERIWDMIARDELKVAIQELSFLLKNSEKLDEIVLQSARYNSLTKQIRMGIIDNTQANITKNQIRFAILEILKSIEDLAENDSQLKEEIEKLEEPNVKASKNVIQGSNIQVGGDFHVGDINLSTSGTTEDTRRILEILKKKKKNK